MYRRGGKAAGVCGPRQVSNGHHADGTEIPRPCEPKFSLGKRPALRAFFLVLFGILLAEYGFPQTALPFLLGWICLLCSSILRAIRDAFNIADSFLCLTVVLFVMVLHSDSRIAAAREILRAPAEGLSIGIAGTISTQPVARATGSSVVLQLDSLRLDEAWCEDRRRCVLTVAPSQAAESLHSARIGDAVIAAGRLIPFPGPRNPGEFDYGRFLLLSGIRGTVRIGRTDSLLVDGTHRAVTWGGMVGDIQENIFALFDRLHPPEHASLLNGVVWGFRADIPEEVKQSFMETGTIHILAVSGSNVAVVALALSSVLGLLRLHRRVLTGAVVLGLLAYMVITGSSPSVVRATVMAIVMILGTVAERRVDVYNSLGAAACILLLMDTNTLFDPGFILSFSAVWSLIYFYGPLERFLRRLPDRIEEMRFIMPALQLFAVSLAAQIGTMPYTIAAFGRISLISVFANLVVVPVSGLNVLLGFAEVMSAPISSWLVEQYAAVNDLLVAFLLAFVHGAASVPYAAVSVAGLSLSIIFIYYSVAFASVHMYRAAIFKLVCLGLSLCGLFVLALSAIAEDDPNLWVTVLDVGQGDAVVVEFPNGRTMLVDAGPSSSKTDAGERTVIPFLQRKGIRTLDMVVLTHSHDDHAGGLQSILEQMSVRAMATGESSIWPRRLDSLTASKEAEGMLVRYLRAGDQLELDPAVRCYVLAPELPVRDERGQNARSVVLKIVMGNVSFLLTGDLEESGESTMCERFGDFVDVDVLKAGHHGSSTSNSELLLNYASPRFVAVSVGTGNKFNHPTSFVIERFRQLGAEIHRTDHSGAAVFETDGNSLNRINWR